MKVDVLKFPRHGLASVESVAQLVGKTPLLRMEIPRELEGIEIHAKLEFFNPGGSVKDRAAMLMVQKGLEQGLLGPGKTLIDSTSGNTGVAYSWIGAALGQKVALVMPSNVSLARKQIAKAFGAEVIYSDPMEGSDGAIRLVRQLVQEHPEKYFYPDQYSNECNPLAHVLSTAPEIWRQTQGRVTHFVCGIGTSGSVMGTGRGLRKLNPKIKVHPVEPAEALHGLEGLKHMPSSLIPSIYRESELDDKISVTTDEGWAMSEKLLSQGLSVGHSAGAAMAGALKVAEGLAQRGEKGVIVTLFPDRADRYFEPMKWERKFEFK